MTAPERPLDPEQYPDSDPELLVPGSLVFRKTGGPVPLDDYRNWWEYLPGASWKRPGGKGTTINGRDRHPVVQVAYEDAETRAPSAPRATSTSRAAAPGRGGEPVLYAAQPARRLAGAELPARSAEGAHPEAPGA